MQAVSENISRTEEATNQFIEFWAEMASHWGINKTMAQIHALLYAVEDPMDTDMIMARLGISRGNANMNLHSLIRWSLVMKVNVPGSRKDYFTAEKDVWTIMAQIIKNREQQEIAPIVEKLTEFQQLFKSESKELTGDEEKFVERMENLSELMSVFREVTQTLIPFVHSDNIPLIQQLVRFAESMNSVKRAPSKTDDA